MTKENGFPITDGNGSNLYRWEKVDIKDANKIAYLLHLRIPVKSIVNRISKEKIENISLNSPFGPVTSTTKYLEPTIRGVEEFIFCSRYSLGVLVARMYNPEEILAEILYKLEIPFETVAALQDDFTSMVSEDLSFLEFSDEEDNPDNV
jgi:hypothetical protein